MNDILGAEATLLFLVQFRKYDFSLEEFSGRYAKVQRNHCKMKRGCYSNSMKEMHILGTKNVVIYKFLLANFIYTKSVLV